MEGKVKWYDREKRFGFITSGGKDYFVHESKLPPGVVLKEGDEVSFDSMKDERGRDQANNIQVGGAASAKTAPAKKAAKTTKVRKAKPAEDEEAEDADEDAA